MGLVLPNLDDKPFGQIADEARQLIPSSAPEWTDHNVTTWHHVCRIVCVAG